MGRVRADLQAILFEAAAGNHNEGTFHMSSGLLALLDDVVALAKLAAASLDDAASQAVQASTKSAGIVIDDAAVTPRYVVGFAAHRELPIIAKIAKGSIKNKLLYLLPAALALSAFAPWAITPLLMLGGAYLCFEGYEKVHEWVSGHEPQSSAKAPAAALADASVASAKSLEDEKVAGAIKTDFILSAEIMAIALASTTAPDLFTQFFVLVAVALLVTGGVYGAVALIVKADDAGVALANSECPIRALTPLTKAIGRGLVYGMPPFLKVLSTVGTLAMLWVGGGIIIHGLAQMGIHGPEHAIQALATSFGASVPGIGRALAWFVEALAFAMIGIVIGAVCALIWGLLGPALKTKTG